MTTLPAPDLTPSPVPFAAPPRPHLGVRWEGSRSYLVKISHGREERVSEPGYPGIAIREFSERRGH